MNSTSTYELCTTNPEIVEIFDFATISRILAVPTETAGLRTKKQMKRKQEISIVTSCFNEMLHSVQHDSTTLQTFNFKNFTN